MLSGETKLRVRYHETDQMGYVHHGNYSHYYELARTELFKRLGLSYKELEEKGIMMPVLEMSIRYIKAVTYDEEITVKTTLRELPTVRIKFNFSLFNAQGELVNQADVTLIFIDAKTRRPCRPPAEMLEVLKPYFE